MISRFIIITTTILLLSQQAFAAPRLLTLEECLAIAMDQNLDIRKAREYASYVEGRYIEERAAALPQLALVASAGYSKDESSRLMTGTPYLQRNSSAELTLTQPLFTWGKVSAALKAAEVGLKTADQQLRLHRQTVHLEVSISFYDTLLAKELLRLARENLAQKERHHLEASRRFELGVATDYDLLAAEVALQNARPELIRAENSLKINLERLRFLLGPDQQELDLAGSLTAEIRTAPGYDQAVILAYQNRPELLDQRLRIGINQELVRIADADDKPRLDLLGAAGWRQMEFLEPGPRRSSDGLAWNAALQLSFPFFDGLRSRGRVQQAKSELRSSRIQEEKLQNAISLELRTSLHRLTEAAETINALSGTVRQAKRLLEMAEKGFEYGVKTRLELDDAQTNLLRAESNLAMAHRDYQVSFIYLQKGMGIAGEHAGLTHPW